MAPDAGNAVRSGQTEGVRWWSRLRMRMGLSYAVVTLFIVLALEALLLSAALYIFTQTPFLGYVALERTGRAAQVYALQASVLGSGETLNPQTTFEPGSEATIALQQDTDSPVLSYFHLDISYVAPGTIPATPGTFALLIDPEEQVLASSYPQRYPPGVDVSELLPDEIGLIRGALDNRADGLVHESGDGMYVANAHPVRSKDGQALGAVYVQAPSGVPANPNLLSELVSFLIPSGLLWLCLMLPIGLLFGVLTTRGMIRRVEGLARATAHFTAGDFSQRVAVKKRDEIGQLETQFNFMAEQLVDSFAQRQAIAADSARREERARIEQELRSARYVQQSLLPEQVPAIEGWQTETYYNPARDVGGDLYDFIALPDGRLGIVIGDVSGKGMPAALIMATTCAMMRAAAREVVSPGQVLGAVNNLMQPYVPSATFITCFYAILDPSSGALQFANAGHDIPYLSRDGEIVELRARGMPLGLLPEQPYEEGTVTVCHDDAILFYTDGLVEAHDAERQMFSFERLQALLKEQSAAGDLIKVLLQELQAFTGPDWEQEDDITLVVVRKVDSNDGR